MKKKLNLSAYFAVGSMLFGMFFGAGNLIFPVHMGQEAGRQIFPAAIGFILTATGLPFLGVLAIGISDSGNLLGLAQRVGRKWSYIFTIMLYMTIGPFFALPRTATVSYEIGFSLFLPDSWQQISLLVFTLIFFGIALFFSLRPGKLLIWVGKVLNPLFLLLLSILIIASFVYPMGNIGDAAIQADYAGSAFFKGFTEGYNTMDALASLAFGVLVVNALKDLEIKQPKDIVINTAKAGLVSVLLMVVIYSCLSYMGAASIGQLSLSENGGIALTQMARFYFGFPGSILLALLVAIACLKTAIGLITSCADIFVEMFPKFLSYRAYVLLFTILGCAIANLGLTQIIRFSIPVLMFLYPLAIVLILLTLMGRLFQGRQTVYVATTVIAALFSIGDAFAAAPMRFQNLAGVHYLLSLYEKMPFFKLGMAWALPALCTFLIGVGYTLLRPNHLKKLENKY